MAFMAIFHKLPPWVPHARTIHPNGPNFREYPNKSGRFENQVGVEFVCRTRWEPRGDLGCFISKERWNKIWKKYGKRYMIEFIDDKRDSLI